VVSVLSFCLPRPALSTIFPYTTLFRSCARGRGSAALGRAGAAAVAVASGAPAPKVPPRPTPAPKVPSRSALAPSHAPADQVARGAATAQLSSRSPSHRASKPREVSPKTYRPGSGKARRPGRQARGTTARPPGSASAHPAVGLHQLRVFGPVGVQQIPVPVPH